MQIASYRCLVLGLVLTVGLSRFAETASAAPVPSIKLRADNLASFRNRSLEQTKKEVTLIFNRIGVKTEWVMDGSAQLTIVVVERMPDPIQSSGEIFGYTPRDSNGAHSGRAYVSLARIREFILDSERWRYPPLNPVYVLAYFIAHEIGHLLLPAGSHSSTGIMRARWKESDFKSMATANMSFTAEQAELIRGEVSRLAKNLDDTFTTR